MEQRDVHLMTTLQYVTSSLAYAGDETMTIVKNKLCKIGKAMMDSRQQRVNRMLKDMGYKIPSAE